MRLQLLAGLITYLLLVLYCYTVYGEKKPSIKRLRQLRSRIRQERQRVIYLINLQFNVNVMVLPLLLLFFIRAIF